MKVDLAEFRSAYLAEVEEHLADVRARLVTADEAVRASRPCGRELRDALRLVHTIKGLSAMVGIEPIVTIAHRMESLLRDVERRRGAKLDARSLEALVQGTSAIAARVRSVADGEPVPEAPRGLLTELDELEAVAAGAPVELEAVLDDEIASRLDASERAQLDEGVRGGRRAVRVDFVPSKEKSEAGISIATVRERVSAVAEIVKIVPLRTSAGITPGGLVFALVLLTSLSDAEIAEAAAADLASVHVLASAVPAVLEPHLESATLEAEPLDEDERASGSLRVEVSRVDDAIEKLSALVVTRSRLARAVAALSASGAPTRELEAILVDHARQIRDLRASILRVRMVPLSAVLDRLPLLVRSLARTTGKDVALEVYGGAAELDKSVAERIFPTLVHLLRNAVDHGIEPSAERVAAGKPPVATIAVSCTSEANRSVEIRVRDDGRGIDAEQVLRRAGLPAGRAADGATLLDLICRPGFSTRAKADETSGRGVGMDVVRRVVVDQLGGELSLETDPGEGTTFLLRVPLTISIVDAFTVRCGSERFAVPVGVVEEIVEVDESRMLTGPGGRAGVSRFMLRRGESVPVVDLAHVLGVSGASQPKHAFVVRRGRREPVAFAVDRVLGQQEVVVRPLADPLVAVTGLTGSTDLGDGIATLVVDLLGLSAALVARSEAA